MKTTLRILTLLALSAFIVSWSPFSASAEEPVWTQGTIKKVKLDQGKISIRHGEIKNLDMPGMSMIFRVADPKMLEGLKPKQKVEFYVVMKNGSMLIKQIRAK
jgi:Cu(I)/Ag(I) efflux system periplasmic protein CusF